MKTKEVVSQPTIEENIAKVVFDLKTKWGETKISVKTIHLVLKECMELVDNFDCSGAEKKKHVVRIVKEVIKDLVEDEDQERIILEIIDKEILENTIDLIILASKGKLNINNKVTQKKIVSCTKSCIPIVIDIVMQIIKACKQSNRRKNQTVSDPSGNTIIPTSTEVVLTTSEETQI